MRIKDILNITGKILPYIGFFIGTQSFKMAKEAKAARLQEASNEAQRLLIEIKNQQETMISDQLVQTKIASLSSDAITHLDLAKQDSKIIGKLLERLNDPSITEAEKNFILNSLNEQSSNKLKSLDNANDILNNILDIISSNKNNYLNNFNEIINRFQNYLSSLTLEQLVPLVNIFGLTVITSCLISIAIIFYGDYFIKYFNIENKYPKLAKFIKKKIPVFLI
jgi:Rad3-related DNA helicase